MALLMNECFCCVVSGGVKQGVPEPLAVQFWRLGWPVCLVDQLRRCVAASPKKEEPGFFDPSLSLSPSCFLQIEVGPGEREGDGRLGRQCATGGECRVYNTARLASKEARRSQASAGQTRDDAEGGENERGEEGRRAGRKCRNAETQCLAGSG